MGLIRLVIILALVIAAGAGIYYYSVQQIEIEDVRMEEVKLKGLGFTLVGDVDVHNGGFLRLNVKNITYSIIAEETGGILTEGIVDGGNLAPGETKTFGFENDISFLSSGESLLAFLNTDNAFVRIIGVITLSNDIKIPFEKREDLGPYLKDIAGKNATDMVSADIEGMAESMKDMLQAALA